MVHMPPSQYFRNASKGLTLLCNYFSGPGLDFFDHDATETGPHWR